MDREQWWRFRYEILNFTIEADDLKVANAEGTHGVEAAIVENELVVYNLDNVFDEEEDEDYMEDVGFDDQNALKDLLNDIF